MKLIKCNKFVVLFAVAIALVSQVTRADWQLNNDASILNFISTKNEHISEIHSFTSLSGSLSEAGDLTVNVDLASVNTNIPIRDQRMQDLLFDIKTNPVAKLSATLDKQVLALATGHSLTKTITANITVSGVMQAVDITVSVNKDNDGEFTATTVQPFIIQVSAFNLTDGINKLKQIAGLNSISLAVPVTFSVKFEQE